MASVPAIVRRVKDDAKHLLDPKLICDLCVAAGHDWRVRALDPLMTISIMMLQTLHATSCRGALRAAGVAVSATAYCQAKKRMPLEVIQQLVVSLADQVNRATTDIRETTLWLGHRVLMIDGSSASMPDTPSLQKRFGQPGNAKPGCGFPVVHLLTLFDQFTGTIIDLLTHPCNTHDMAHASKLHPMLEPGDVLLGDRGFCSYAHLCLLLQDNLHGMFRLHQRQIVSFRKNRKCRSQLPKGKRAGAPTSRFVRKLGRHDQIVEYVKPKECPDWMSQQDYDALPGAILVRELRYRRKSKRGRTWEVTLVTTLLDPEKYPKKELVKLYGSRWEVETRLLEFKRTLGANVLRSTSVEGVLKDLWMHVLMYNLIRVLMLQHAKQRACDPRRLSFIDARDVLRFAGRHTAIPLLVLIPLRPGRDEPRVIKRRKDCYSYMSQPRDALRQTLGNKGDMA